MEYTPAKEIRENWGTCAACSVEDDDYYYDRDYE